MKSLCLTLNYNVNERGNLFSPFTDCELSRRESNPKLPELSVINGYHILRTSTPHCARNSNYQSGQSTKDNYKKAQDVKFEVSQVNPYMSEKLCIWCGKYERVLGLTARW